MSFDLRRPLSGSLAAFVLNLLLSSACSPAQAAVPKPVSVFPSPGTPVVSDTTTFSFRNVEPKLLGPVKIYGSRSGRHFWRPLAHSDGRGVSVVPKRRFMRGETIRVFTDKRIKLARGGDFHVRVGRFYGSNIKPGQPAGNNHFPRLHSRPDLRPPRLKVLTRNSKVAPGKMLFAPKQTGLTIADKLGRITWFRPTHHGGRGQVVQNFRAQTLYGRPVLTYWNGERSPRTKSQIGRFNVLNDRYERIARFSTGNGYQPDAHEFTITRRNTALVLAYRALRWDLSKQGGPKDGKLFDNVVQEIDIKTGAVRFEWHSVGSVGLESNLNRPPRDGSPWDYFHVNSAWDDGDSLLVSARKVSSIYRIDRRSGIVKWRLRGDLRKPGTNGFKLGPEASFGYQHDAIRLPNGDISLFDNGSAAKKGLPTVRKQSSGLILRLRGSSSKNRTARLVKRYNHRPRPIVSGSQGSTMVLPNGNAFIGWGSRNQITEFTRSGKVAFDAYFSAAANSYRARKAGWSGRPKRRPAIASRGKGKRASVWASWNGAGNIKRWKVLSGPGASKLKQVASSEWKGLETTIPVSGLGNVVRVQALDSSGKVLGQSHVVARGKQSGGR